MTGISGKMQEHNPLSAVPLLKNSATARPFRGSRCSAAKILIIGCVTILLISVAVVASFVLLTTYSSAIMDSRSRNSTKSLFNETDDHPEENPLEAFAGDWKLVHQENFEEFLYIIGTKIL